jgi:hypothetical protein
MELGIEVAGHVSCLGILEMQPQRAGGCLWEVGVGWEDLIKRSFRVTGL